MRILFVSNYLSNSGYAQQARLIVPAIIALGHEVEVLPIAAMNINIITHAPDGVKLLPMAQDQLGNDIVRHHYTAGEFDAVMTFTDVWGLVAQAYADLNWYPLTPIDTYTLAPDHAASIRAAKFPIAISRFGQKVIKAETGIEAKYLPMMIDTDFWKPGSQEIARRTWGMSLDKTIFMFIGVNQDVPSRKGIPELLAAWAQCKDELDDSVYLHLHTAKRGGIDVEAMAQQLGILPERLRITEETQYHTGLDNDDMLLMVQAADCLIQPSRREGACLPLLEAQACGIPVIASNAHAQSEYNFGDYRVKGERVWGLLGAWEFAPSVENIKKQILQVVQHIRENRRQPMQPDFSIPTVTANYLQPILEAISMDVLSRE